MYTYNVSFDEYGVSIHIPFEFYEAYKTSSYFKRLKKVASKGYIVGYEITDNEIIYYETNRLKGFKRYRIDKNQQNLTEVQIYMIEDILKNAPYCPFANQIKTKNAIFVNYLSENYSKNFTIPMAGGAITLLGIFTPSLAISPLYILIALGVIGAFNLTYGAYSIISSIVKTNEEAANIIYDMPLEEYLESSKLPELVENKPKKPKDIFKDEIKALLVEINDILSKLESPEREKFKKILEEKYAEYKNQITKNDDLDITFQLNSAYFIVFLTELRRNMLKSLDLKIYITTLDNTFIRSDELKKVREKKDSE